MKRYQNISLCQINVKTGVQEYYLPKNANWLGKKIEKIIALIPDNTQVITSPVDGQTLLVGNDLADMYFDLFNEDGQNIMHNVQAYQLSDVNNYPLEIRQKLNFELSRVHFTSAPVQDGAVLLYLFYGATEANPTEPTENITVNFTVPAQERMTFTNVIERYMYARAKGVRYITVWNGRRTPEYYHTGFITLRDISGKLAHEHISTHMLRPQFETMNGEPMLANKIPLDVVELDFNNSYIFNSTSSDQDYIVTFYY